MLEDPENSFSFIVVNHKITLRSDVISVAFTLCHFGAASLESLSKTRLNSFTFLITFHYKTSLGIKNSRSEFHYGLIFNI